MGIYQCVRSTYMVQIWYLLSTYYTCSWYLLVYTRPLLGMYLVQIPGTFPILCWYFSSTYLVHTTYLPGMYLVPKGYISLSTKYLQGTWLVFTDLLWSMLKTVYTNYFTTLYSSSTYKYLKCYFKSGLTM